MKKKRWLSVFKLTRLKFSTLWIDIFSEAIRFLELSCLSKWIHVSYQKQWDPMRAFGARVQVKTSLKRVL